MIAASGSLRTRNSPGHRARTSDGADGNADEEEHRRRVGGLQRGVYANEERHGSPRQRPVLERLEQVHLAVVEGQPAEDVVEEERGGEGEDDD